MWSLLDAGLSLLILENVRSVSELNLNRYLSWVWSNSTIIILWSTLYFGIKLWNDWLEAKSRAEKSDALAHKAQLQMLRYQLNPHFLFNSLNSIRALVDEDKLRAKSMITELSEFLRYSLVNKNLANVTLNEELEAIRHYFAIEKTRFEEKLEVTFQIDFDTEKIKIPSFLIHPIIENAIKFGMKTTKLPLRINIKSELKNNWLNIEIYNSGVWVENSESNISTGTGLENVKQRLENAYPNNNRFEVIESDDKVCVIISIPINNEE
jgi:LytS/YehU family sensor histidine kinase